MSLINLKETIEKFVVDGFFKQQEDKVFANTDEFLYILDDINNFNTDTFNLIMGSIIYDVYGVLNYRCIFKGINKFESSLLKDLNKVETFDEAIDVSLSKENVGFLLGNVYRNHELSLHDKITAKNMVRNIAINSNIVKWDKTKIFDDIYLYGKNLLFSKNYKKEEYLYLFDTLKKEYMDELSSLNAFVNVIYGMHFYNKSNYVKLVIDMCLEFLFQKEIVGAIDKNDYREEYLSYLIKSFNINRILHVITCNDDLMATLACGYSNYYYFESDMRRQMETDSIDEGIREAVKKLCNAKKRELEQ